MDKLEERRKFQRIPCNFPVKFKDLNKPETEYRGTVSKNVGEGGVRFRSSRFISLACRLVVELNLPTIQRPIRAVSKITWIKKLPVGDDYEVGNQFLEISREDRDIIRDYVKDNLQSSIL